MCDYYILQLLVLLSFTMLLFWLKLRANVCTDPRHNVAIKGDSKSFYYPLLESHSRKPIYLFVFSIIKRNEMDSNTIWFHINKIVLLSLSSSSPLFLVDGAPSARVFTESKIAYAKKKRWDAWKKMKKFPVKWKEGKERARRNPYM